MSNKHTDLETSRKLEKVMAGVVTEKVRVRYKVEIQISYKEHSTHGRRYSWSEWKLYSKDNIPFAHDEIETVPCYDLHDLLGKLPDEVEHEGVKYTRLLLPSFIGYKDFGLNNYLQGFGIGTEVSILQAAASLLLWVSEQGYGEVEG